MVCLNAQITESSTNLNCGAAKATNAKNKI